MTALSATLKKVLLEKGYGSDTPGPRLQARAGPAPLPGVVLGPSIIRQASQQAGPLPKGRLSRGPSDISSGNIWYWNPEQLGLQSRRDVIHACRSAAMMDSDASSSKRDIIALANPGYTLELTGSDLAKKKAYKEIELLGERLGDFRGWDELINHQIGEAYVAGACSLEAYPNLSRTGVAGVEIVPAEEVSILRAGNDRLYRQMTYGADLDPRTFVYAGYGQQGRDPHGTPAMVSALIELERKATLILGTDKIVNLIAEGAFLQLGVPKPTLQELGVQSELDPEYTVRLTEFYTSYVTIATQAREKGVMVTENGADAKVVPITGNVSGIAELMQINSLRAWNGLMTLPFMRGKTEGTTQALAEVMYPILISHSENIQITVSAVVEFVMNLHLRLAGIAASVKLDWVSAPNPFKLSHAQAALVEAQMDAVYLAELGDPYLEKVAIRLDLDPAAVLAWREKNRPQPPPLSLKQDVQTPPTPP